MTVQNFRSLDVGKVALWIAVPQLLVAPLIAMVLRWVDPRFMLAGRAVCGWRWPAAWPAA